MWAGTVSCRLDIPKELHTAVRKVAVKNDVSLKDTFIRALTELVEREREQ